MIDLWAKRAYVSGTRVVRTALAATGVLLALERSDSRRAKWFRSLFAIYDLDDMERLGVPWWTFDAIDAVEAFMARTPNARVYEWGSGASTLWLADRAGEVISTEFDPDWHRHLTAKLAGVDHVTVRLTPAGTSGDIPSGKSGFSGLYFDDFVRAIRNCDGDFDVIVIDGRAREACLSEAIPKLKPGGIIIFDDTKRDRYKRAIAASGLPARRLDGMAVALPLADSTTLIAKDAAVLSFS